MPRFYKEPGDRILRFGDVLSGYVLVMARQPHAHLPRAVAKGERPEFNCQLDVQVPKYCVLLTPCCSIGMAMHYSRDRMLLVAPLVRVNHYWFRNPVWADDLLKINHLMRADRQVPPDDFRALTAEQQAQLKTIMRYPLSEYFVYAGHPSLDPYPVKRPEGESQIRLYAVNFLDTYHLVCSDIVSREKFPEQTKLLQLTARTREELRRKIAAWYGHRPEEDEQEDPAYFMSVES